MSRYCKLRSKRGSHFNKSSVVLCFLAFLFIFYLLFLPKTYSMNESCKFSWGPDVLISDEVSDLAISTKRGYTIRVDGSTIHVVWSSVISNSNSEIYYRKSNDNGSSWLNSIRLTDVDGLSMVPMLAVRRENVFVVWKDDRNSTEPEIFFKSSFDNGENWGTDVHLTETSDASNTPAVDVYQDNVYVVWEEKISDPATCKAYFISSQDEGTTWENPVLLSEDIPKREDGAPSIAVGEGNIIHVVYGSDKHAQETAGYNWENYYRRSTDKGESWENPVRLTDDTIGDTRFPVIAASGSKVHVAWWDDRDDTTYTHYGYPPAQPEEYKNYEIYYMRSLDNGITWQEYSRLTHADRISKAPSIIARGDTVLVVWQDQRDGNFEIYLKYSADGGANWSEDIRATNDPYFSKLPSVAVDSFGCIYLLWTDNRTGAFEVYFKKSDFVITGVDQSQKWNTRLTSNLKQNYPNPFNSITTIKYEVSRRSLVQLVIYNIFGEKIARLVNEEVTPGIHEVQWGAKDSKGGDVPSGIYICKLKTGSIVQTGKILLVR